MTLTPGTRIGPYEVLGDIGAGGMGEVYRARDSKLERDVALKILPATFSSDADRLARFEREARTLASLSHGNIAHVYDAGRSDSGAYLVMELVSGEDLSARIARGPIAVADVLPIARQIAEALEAAHEAGIVHRDLKPANVKVKDDGTVKVLDFGLAKALGSDQGDGSARGQDAPTVTTPAMTQMGLILGTAAYMAPEQAKGRAVDKRADIWAFGVVLYEMVTGRRLFDAEDVTETIAAVLTRDVDVKALPSGTPARLGALIRRCLVRDQKQRLRDIGEARIELDRIASGGPDETAPIAPTAGARRLAWLWPAAALISLAAAGALAIASLMRPEPIVEPVRFPLIAPSDMTLRTFRLSPDGRRLAVAGGPGLGTGDIRVYSFDTGTFAELSAAAATTPLILEWSADSQHVLFTSEGKLRTAPIGGGPSRVLANVPVGRPLTATWSTQGVILLSPTVATGPIYRVPDSPAGELTAVTELDAAKNEISHRYPSFLPDGRHFTFVAVDALAGRQGYVGTLDSKERWLLPGVVTSSRYSPSGHLLFLRDGALMAQPFDPGRGTLSGSPRLVAEGIADPDAVSGMFFVNDRGTLAYHRLASTKTTLFWYDRNGKQIQAAGPSGAYADIELSLDDRYVAYESGAPGDIWVLDLQNGVSQRLTSDAARDADPTWAPDSKTIAFRGDRDGGHLYSRRFGVVGEDTRLLDSKTRDSPASYSRDGKYLAFQNGGGLFALPLSGDRTPISVAGGGASEAEISPDSRWIAYQSVEQASQAEIFVQSFPRPGARLKVTPAGGRTARWSRDGHELFYIGPGNVMMSVAVTTKGDAINLGTPQRLFQLNFQSGVEGVYAVSSTGRFLVNLRTLDLAAEPITVILNWAAGLGK